jgi:hypothetical protein
MAVTIASRAVLAVTRDRRRRRGSQRRRDKAAAAKLLRKLLKNKVSHPMFGDRRATLMVRQSRRSDCQLATTRACGGTLFPRKLTLLRKQGIEACEIDLSSKAAGLAAAPHSRMYEMGASSRSKHACPLNAQVSCLFVSPKGLFDVRAKHPNAENQA